MCDVQQVLRGLLVCGLNASFGLGGPTSVNGGFFFVIFKKKLKFQKYMSVLKNFKNIPRSPYGGDRVQM